MKKLFILFVAVAMVAAFTVPAMAEAEWNFYGSARMGTWYVDDDQDVAGVPSDKGTVWAQQGNSRIGATVKFNDEIGGGFEMSDSFGKRKLYGTYNFGAGQLLLGQTYTPSANFWSNSVYDGDGDLLGVGQFYMGRAPMVQLKFGGFKFALISPVTVDYGVYDTDVTLPKAELSFDLKTDVFFVNVFAGYNTYDLEATVPGVSDEDVTSMVYGLGGGANIGPVFVKAGVHAGTNLGNYGGYNPHGVNDEAALVAGSIEDNDALGYLLVVGFKAGDAATIEAGYGYQEYDSGLTGEQADETVQYYVNATINITKGFFIVPEVGIIDRDDSAIAGVSQGDITYFGLKWQINF